MPRKSNIRPGGGVTRKVTRGPNKGDTVTLKGGPSSKPYPTRVVSDVGKKSTLRNNPGVKFGKGKK